MRNGNTTECNPGEGVIHEKGYPAKKIIQEIVYSDKLIHDRKQLRRENNPEEKINNDCKPRRRIIYVR